MRNEEWGIMVSPCGDDFFVGANSVRPCWSPAQLHENPKLATPRNGLSISVSLRTEISPSPYKYSDKSYRRKIATLFADFTLCRRIVKRCRFNSPISLSSDILFLYAFDTTICTLSAYAEWGSASYSARGFAPRPHKPSSAGPPPALYLSLRSVLYFTLCLQFTLVSYAHSSLLTPHSSFLISHSSPPH